MIAPDGIDHHGTSYEGAASGPGFGRAACRGCGWRYRAWALTYRARRARTEAAWRAHLAAIQVPDYMPTEWSA